ncbi:venom carboxylesterase-6-like [Amphibalanus amphitrite]|uniref:venom carboxylesterase-6-like n=1 Tax=Amphibalanus amphitrite TaxID=1232801 RepID=UPI001C908A7C|nr:venom carboxylesterase-6-like [Amphibalanus amphitrite]
MKMRRPTKQRARQWEATSLLLWLLLLPAAATVTGCADPSCRPLVTTREGTVRGTVGQSADGRPYLAFRGVRYGAPPVGALRFQPPLRHPGWQGVVEADRHGTHCLQVDSMDGDTIKGAEDCLFANVYSPRLPDPSRPATAGLPVMVFIHGGGFTIGSGDDEFYGPSYFMDEDVVLVTFNYRLGPFGFFTTHDAAAPGNYGLLDQVLLLHWVQDNIAAFGGDPRAVTIFGVSAGGASVSLLVLSPLARGLFHRAISQSGTSVASFAASGRRKDAAQTLAARLGCPTGDSAALVGCVRAAPAEAVVRSVRGEKELFQPRMDGADSRQPLLPDDPRRLLERGAFNRVPWISGITAEEGAFFLPFTVANTTLMAGVFAGQPAAWARLADLCDDSRYRVLDCGYSVEGQGARVRQFYVSSPAGGGGVPGPNNLLPVVRVLSDRLFVAPMVAETRLASRFTTVYRYLLDERGAGRLTYRRRHPAPVAVPDFGPTHADDVLYLFSNSQLPTSPRNTPSGHLIRLIVSTWVTFARTGRPAAPGLPDWPAFTELTQQHMRLNTAPSVDQRLFEARADFWQTVPINEPWRHVVQMSCRLGGAASGQPGTATGF